jgi:hypothetical protein
MVGFGGYVGYGGERGERGDLMSWCKWQRKRKKEIKVRGEKKLWKVQAVSFFLGPLASGDGVNHL